MNKTIYPKQTLQNLKEVVFGDKCANDSKEAVLTRAIAGAFVPWEKHDKVVSKEELVISITDYVINSFKTFTGNVAAYATRQEERWLVYATLFGINAADSLLNVVSEDGVTVSRIDGEWCLSISGMYRTSNSVWYTDSILSWCKRMCPSQLYYMGNNELVDVMFPAYKSIGEHALALPSEPVYDDRYFTEIYRTTLESMSDLNLDMRDLDVYMMECKLYWSMKNAPTEVLSKFSSSNDWVGLCNYMSAKWGRHLAGMEVSKC